MRGKLGWDIIDAKWTPRVNVILLQCRRCGTKTRAPANRRRVRCSRCFQNGDMLKIKGEL